MSHHFTISPDFNPDRISGWYIFNTWLQKHLETPIHLELYHDFSGQQQAVREDRIDLIYANPYDTAMLVREKGFLPIARPTGLQDEGVIVVRHDHPAQTVEDLQPGTKVATTPDPDVNMICMIMLEPADLDNTCIQRITCDSYVLVAKEVLRGTADVGFILKDSFEEFSKMLKSQLRPLVVSSIRDIYHTLLVGPRLAARHEDLQMLLVNMEHYDKGPGVLNSLGFHGWEIVEQEDMEFMIDLMDTLEN